MITTIQKNLQNPRKTRPLWILPIIILSQFTGGSLWFSGNAILTDLVMLYHIDGQIVGYATSAVQLGFILGTLFFAWFTISDRYSPRIVFFTCTLLGAFCNSLLILLPVQLLSLCTLRFLTGFFLAGIYPVGMKIASGWYKSGLGRALGYLVGALVLGTGSPHLIKAIGFQLPWQYVLGTTSLFAVSGGLAILLFVPDGPYLNPGNILRGKALGQIWHQKDVRAAAFGYFGHMWELYTLWAFLPSFLLAYVKIQHLSQDHNPLDIPLWSFLIIGSGSLGCVLGGLISTRVSSARIAFMQLVISGCCCLLSPLFFSLSPSLFLTMMFIWGITAAGDSPQYSTVIAHTAPKELIGSTLTLVNCVGFFITVVSIQLVSGIAPYINMKYIFLILAAGPLSGLYSMRHLVTCRYHP